MHAFEFLSDTQITSATALANRTSNRVASLSSAVSQEQLRARTTEASMALSSSAQEGSLASTLMVTQASLAQASLLLSSTQSSISSTQASLAVAQQQLLFVQSSAAASSSTKTSILNRLNSIAACINRGMFADDSGSCFTPSPSCSADSFSSASCLPGYFPFETSIPASTCGDSSPLTSRCQGRYYMLPFASVT